MSVSYILSHESKITLLVVQNVVITSNKGPWGSALTPPSAAFITQVQIVEHNSKQHVHRASQMD